MKILLLTLVLGLVWADPEPQSENNESLITGEWYTISTASNDIEKIRENGSLRGYVRWTECSNNCNQVYITLYQKINGVCQKHTAVGTRTEKDSYMVAFSGEYHFQFIFKLSNILVIYAENADAESKTTLVTELFSRELSISEEDYQKFKELTEEKGIPTENIEDVITTDDCPN